MPSDLTAPYDPHVPGLDAALLASRLRAARGGDIAAFNDLVLHYQRQVYSVCYRTLGSAEDAADAAQDAFLHAHRAVGSYRGEGPEFRAWLLRIAVNACYDMLRGRQRHPASSLDLLVEQQCENGALRAAEIVTDRTPGPEQRALTSETARRIQECLGRLSPDQRLCAVLCDVQGLNYEEAALAMQVEIGTVKSRLSRARARLRDCLTEKGELPAASRRLQQIDG